MAASEMEINEYSDRPGIDHDEADDSPASVPKRKMVCKTCPSCSGEAPIASKKCKVCGEEFPPKTKDWSKIKQLKRPNPTVQRDILERRADTLNHHNGYDVVVLYKRKHVNGVSYFAYGTPGLGELFVSGKTDIGKTFLDMFEAFCTKYGNENSASQCQDEEVSSETKTTTSSGNESIPPGDGTPEKTTTTPSTTPIACENESISPGENTSETVATTTTAPSTTSIACGVSGTIQPRRGTRVEFTPVPQSTGMPSVVFYRQRDENVAVGYLQSNRKTIHGKAVPLGCEAVQVTWVKEERIPAPVVLGDPEENRFLCTGQFFALPRKDLTKVTLVS